MALVMRENNNEKNYIRLEKRQFSVTQHYKKKICKHN